MLEIAGIQPLSLVDWPGKLVCSVFCQGCPWACVYCHNHEILDCRTPGQVPWHEVLTLLQRRVGLLDGVVFSGGEACRQGPALLTAMREVRALGFAVGLHTAGAYPGVLRAALEAGLVDWVGLDIKAPAQFYPQVVGAPGGDRAWESLQVLLEGAQVKPSPERISSTSFPSAERNTPDVWSQPAERILPTSFPDFDYEVRLTLYPQMPFNPLTVASDCLQLGVRNLVIQKARCNGAPPQFQAKFANWDVEYATYRKDLEALEDARITFR